MRYFYDCEFLEDGRTIELISIGIVREDGAEVYAINGDFPLERFEESPWLVANVVPWLPIHRIEGVGMWHWMEGFPDNEAHVGGRTWLRNRLETFFAVDTGHIELWADYGAYDHIALMQLWGPMVRRSPVLPMYTNDLQQLLRSQVVNPISLPQQAHGHHHALEDARHLRNCYDWLMEHRRSRILRWATDSTAG